MWDANAIPRGSRPMDYLQVLSEAPRALVIHGNYLDEEGRVFLATNADHLSLIYCPRTHAYFGHEAYPLVELLKLGVRVALGTDSRASNPNLDLLAEMRHVAGKFPIIDPDVILRMGTLSGAEALGLAAEVGSITPGKVANLVAVPLAEEARVRTEDLLSGVLSGCDAPRTVWLRGAKLERAAD
jgi:cytosine/adenosine deaminase-related metal-dependent hydrolase